MPVTPESCRRFQTELRVTRPARRLIVAHRGVSAGAIPENTSWSAELALRSGADVVEIDATVTRDCVALAHHNGTEPVNLGTAENLTRVDAAQALALPYLASRCAGRPVTVQRLEDVVDVVRNRDALVHIDRGWRRWGPVLRALDRMAMPERIVLKGHANPADWAEVAAHPVPYPAIVIARCWADVERMRAVAGLNVVGVEFLAEGADDELAQAGAFERAHERGLSVLVNAETLEVGPPLFAGWNDQAGIVDPAAAWGRLASLGADDIQTDVPWLVAAERERWARQAG